MVLSRRWLCQAQDVWRQGTAQAAACTGIEELSACKPFDRQVQQACLLECLRTSWAEAAEEADLPEQAGVGKAAGHFSAAGFQESVSTALASNAPK